MLVCVLFSESVGKKKKKKNFFFVKSYDVKESNFNMRSKGKKHIIKARVKILFSVLVFMSSKSKRFQRIFYFL